jgi:site-specific DNA-methyltransferase (adenine-specific)/site-specific DNA-methyltransferase (cytosine-N4-specific)
MPGQLGAEKTPAEYVGRLVAIFAEVRRVLRDDGTLWLNLGDSYTSGNRTWRPPDKKNHARGMSERAPTPPGLRPKNLVGIPWRAALALQDDGWNLRSDIVWAKPNPMPESVSDRPTRSHEFIFLFTKSLRYFYDAAAIAEPVTRGYAGSTFTSGKTAKAGLGRTSEKPREEKATRNARSVWTITPKPYAGAHFAVFPPELPRRCIQAGSRTGDVVLDPFAGSGTTLAVAKSLGRSYIGIDLNPDYRLLVEQRVRVGA